MNKKICQCNNVYQKEIEKLIKDGVTNLSEIEKETRAMSRCGACIMEIELLILKNKKQL